MHNVLLSRARPSGTYACSVHTPGALWGTGSPDAGPWREGWALPGSLLLPDLTWRQARTFSPLVTFTLSSLRSVSAPRVLLGRPLCT